jgi:hypothetical protein
MRPADLQLFGPTEVAAMYERRVQAREAVERERSRRRFQLVIAGIVSWLFGVFVIGFPWGMLLIPLTLAVAWGTMKCVERFG